MMVVHQALLKVSLMVTLMLCVWYSGIQMRKALFVINSELLSNVAIDQNYTWGERSSSVLHESRQLASSNGSSMSIPVDHDQIHYQQTDKHITHALSLLKCSNQTQCIKPELQLRRKYKVYLCRKVDQGIRFYFLIKEGLLLHPMISIVSTPEEADIVVYLPMSSVWAKSECSKEPLRSKLVVLDEKDDSQQLFQAKRAAHQVMMFKRSYVTRNKGVFTGYLDYAKRIDILPMSYSMAEAYVNPIFFRLAERDLELLCTLRVAPGDVNRARIHEWVAEYGRARGVKNFTSNEVNTDSRRTVSRPYFNQMYRSQIIVTTNPSGWEGDYRLMEAMASGALIFVDQMYVPRPYPLFHDKHFVVYDNNNKTDLFEKLDAYRKDKQMARRVARNGYIHSMRYHRAANLIDYVFRTIHVKQMLLAENKFHLLPDAPLAAHRNPRGMRNLMPTAGRTDHPLLSALSNGYTDTGYHMRQKALSFMNKQDIKLY